MEKPEFVFSCEHCSYHTNRKYDFNHHLLSVRHKNQISKNEPQKNICEKCKKSFKTQSGLWKHINRNICKLLEESKEKMKTNSTITFLKNHCKPVIDIIDVFENIRIEPETYYNDFYRMQYEIIIENIFRNGFSKIPFLERPIYCFRNENPDMEIYYIYHKGVWKRETQLKWTTQILYEEHDEYKTKNDASILLDCIQIFNNNILNDVHKKFNIGFEKTNEGEVLFFPNRVMVIQKLMDIIKVDKSDFLQKNEI